MCGKPLTAQQLLTEREVFVMGGVLCRHIITIFYIINKSYCSGRYEMMTKCFVKQCFVVIARNVFGLPNTDLISRLVREKISLRG